MVPKSQNDSEGHSNLAWLFIYWCIILASPYSLYQLPMTNYLLITNAKLETRPQQREGCPRAQLWGTPNFPTLS